MTLLDLVERGIGVAFVPDVIARLRPSLSVVALADDLPHWTVAAQTVAPAPINPAARAFWETLTQTQRPARAP